MSRGGGARPLLDLARGYLFCSKRVGWEGVTEAWSQACWLGTASGQLGRHWSHLGGSFKAVSGWRSSHPPGMGKEEASGGRAREGRH